MLKINANSIPFIQTTEDKKNLTNQLSVLERQAE